MTTPSNPFYRVAALVSEELSNAPRRYKYLKPKGAPLGYILPGAPSIPHKRVPLTRGLVAYVIPEDYEKAICLTWHARWNENTQSWYAATNMKGADGGHHTEFMHRYLMGVGFRDPRQVDHKNPHDTLNNCRGDDGNLRFATQTENIRNRGKYKSNSTGFIGVFWGQYGRFRPGIRVNKIQIWLGSCATREEAARIRDRAAIKFFGLFAFLNFPLADYEPGGIAYVEGDEPPIEFHKKGISIEERQRIETMIRTTTLMYSEIAETVGFHRSTVRRVAIDAGLHDTTLRGSANAMAKAREGWTDTHPAKTHGPVAVKNQEAS